MTKQLRKLFSIMCAIALLVSSMSIALADETSPAEADSVRIAEEEAAAKKAAEGVVPSGANLPLLRV